MTEPTRLLVDGAAGIYAWKSMAERFPLFREGGTPLTSEEVEGLKGDDWCEQLDWLGDLYVKADDAKLWQVYQDGDIWAVNPEAEWFDLDEWYVMPAMLVSRGFDAGNYASAYTTTDLSAVAGDIPDSEHYRSAFILGFFSSYELHEIPGSDIETFQEAYFSEGGKMAVAAGYTDERPASDWAKLF